MFKILAQNVVDFATIVHFHNSFEFKRHHLILSDYYNKLGKIGLTLSGYTGEGDKLYTMQGSNFFDMSSITTG